jgi:short-subunit dehydrogenase
VSARALITGASSGLGEEFAIQLAREGFALVLVARREDRLQAVAERARKSGAPEAVVLAADLSRPEAPAEIHRRLADEGVAIDWLVNNAGFGTRGRFDRAPLDRELEEINLNISSLVALTRLFIPAMVERRSGIVVNVASTAAFQPVPWMATYAATKAFVLSFSEAIAEELRGSGVTVTALCPGPTRTEFQQVAGVADSAFPSFAYMDAATVVREAIAAARSGKSVKINGMINTVMAESTRIAPRSLVRRIAGAMFRGDS